MEICRNEFHAGANSHLLSKSQNLEYALEHLVGDAEMVVIFDADHHPRPETIEHLIRTLVHNPQFAMAQGSVLVERGGYRILRCLADGMEWASWSFWGPGLSLLVGSAYFGGGNAAWRTDTLKHLGFDKTMLTEDIDVSIRALSLGYRMQFVPWAQVGELCPATLAAFYKQRLRWAMGWEQVTGRRFQMLFNSTRIPESRKWRTMILLVSRYFVLLTVILAVFNSLRPICHHWATGTRLSIPAPIQAAIESTWILTVLGMMSLVCALLVNSEPWWRWCHVVAFVPLSSLYLLWTLLLICISWVKLACCELTWVPTARSASAESHAIRLDTDSVKEYGTGRPACMTFSPQRQHAAPEIERALLIDEETIEETAAGK